MLFHHFFFHCSAPHRYLHSFPTRRSSDLCNSVEDNVCALQTLVFWHFCFDVAVRCGDLRTHLFQRSEVQIDRKSTRLNSSHTVISYAVFCLKKKSITSTSTARVKIPRVSS